MLFIKRFKIKRLTKKIKALQHNRIHNQPSEDALKKEIALYHTLAGIYESMHGRKKQPFAREMSMECYRVAATIEDSEAQYILGNYLLEAAKFREDLQAKGIFASPSNEKQMKEHYEEALAYLTAAEQLGHIKAKRLHGLCYINGWGVEADKKRGFELVVASIEQENSWDKVPQIFAAIGLNKPEFFSALTQFRSKS
ncbi:sel1 repeat family protein [Legionella nagasakiensis]|uniref:sel1 repeat family protein n=1 Tax=Legionella nagasakiensis TaxID=535290 RepID=UPI00105659B0|nr:sel1 repeat family protein [Legionella nagasakiensis]